MNRRFLDDEIEQFVFNIKLKYRGPKNYHYNPYIHGEEKSHKERHKFYNEGVRYLPVDWIQNIQLKNQGKTKNNEKILL